MRVVTLTCSNTEIVHALGCGDLLVGCDSESDWPPELVAGLPRVGRDLDVDAGAVAALRPDLVLASLTVPGHERVVAAIEAAGLPCHAPETVTLDDVHRDIRDIARLLGVPQRAERVCAALRSGIGAAPRDAGGERPSILVQWWPKPVIAPGSRSWVHGMIEAAGGRNALGDRPVKSEPIDDAELARRDPEAIVVSWCGVPPAKLRRDVVTGNPAFAATRAVRHGRVFAVPEAFLGRPGPRLTEGAAALRDVVAACHR